mmetsp:Transcript_24726/g.51274  ORF Transcript_24726/g.51274 Transcript_24726/m.51274 type:complete len:367 (+) Transcript_24726:3-1103(+)
MHQVQLRQGVVVEDVGGPARDDKHALVAVVINCRWIAVPKVVRDELCTGVVAYSCHNAFVDHGTEAVGVEQACDGRVHDGGLGDSLGQRIAEDLLARSPVVREFFPASPVGEVVKERVGVCVSDVPKVIIQFRGLQRQGIVPVAAILHNTLAVVSELIADEAALRELLRCVLLVCLQRLHVCGSAPHLVAVVVVVGMLWLPLASPQEQVVDLHAQVQATLAQEDAPSDPVDGQLQSGHLSWVVRGGDKEEVPRFFAANRIHVDCRADAVGQVTQVVRCVQERRCRERGGVVKVRRRYVAAHQVDAHVLLDTSVQLLVLESVLHERGGTTGVVCGAVEERPRVQRHDPDLVRVLVVLDLLPLDVGQR